MTTIENALISNLNLEKGKKKGVKDSSRRRSIRENILQIFQDPELFSFP